MVPPLHGRDATVWANRCAAFLKLGDNASALADARVARTIEPRYVKVRAWMGRPGGLGVCWCVLVALSALHA